MAAIANIVVNDGAAVAKTFYVSNANADVCRWEERSNTQYIGYNRITMTLRRPTTPPLPRGKGKTRTSKQFLAQGWDLEPVNRNLKVILKVETPILETLSNAASGYLAAPLVSYRPVAECTFSLPERSTLADRKTVLSFMKGLLGDAQAEAAVWNFDMPF